MATDYLHAIRDHELDAALQHFPRRHPAAIVVDIGAGTGRQASRLSALGYDVVAVDLPSSSYARERVFEVHDYDGRTLPFECGTVDVIFSSNVLEHIADHASFFAECHRVLANDGVAIHILPTASWRLWTTLAYYPWLFKRAIALFLGRASRKSAASEGIGASALRNLVPTRHGERGNVLTEAWYFSESWWRRQFHAHGFHVECCRPCGLFYTGTALFGLAIPIGWRTWLAEFLGSSCKIYVLRPRENEIQPGAIP